MSDLLLDLDPALGRTRALEDALRRAIADGRLPPGTSLPSSRSLARDLGCARATVVGAYEQLTAEGFLVGVVGSGTTVSRGPTAPVDGMAPAPDPAVSLALIPGEPDPSSFPRAGWLAALRDVMQHAPDSTFGYGDHRGLPELREVLAAYLARSRAVVAHPSQVLIFGSFAAALSVLATTLHGMGITDIALEDPSLPPHARAVAAAGPRVVPVPVDGHGLVVDHLDGTGAVVCTPAHQYPLGAVLAPARRAELVEWARAGSGWIIEDDYDGEFRYDRRAVGSLQGLAPDRVVYGGTASKSLAPGLGLAWLVVPPPLVQPVLATKRSRRATASNLEQAALARFITKGHLDRHVRARRLAYRRRRDAVVDVLTTRGPWLEVVGVSAGLHVTALLQDGRERDVVDVARSRGVALFGLADHSLGLPAPEGLVIGYSRAPAHAFGSSLADLAGVLDACRPR